MSNPFLLSRFTFGQEINTGAMRHYFDDQTVTPAGFQMFEVIHQSFPYKGVIAAELHNDTVLRSSC